MTEPRVDLPRSREVGEPTLVNVNEVLHAVEQLILVKYWHVQVVAGLDQPIEVQVRSEGLRRTCRHILDNIESLVTGNAVVQTSSRYGDVERSVGSDHWLAPAGLVVPLNRHHVVRVALSKVVILLLWLRRPEVGFYDLDVRSLQAA